MKLWTRGFAAALAESLRLSVCRLSKRGFASAAEPPKNWGLTESRRLSAREAAKSQINAIERGGF
jgi:hypothetical protein